VTDPHAPDPTPSIASLTATNLRAIPKVEERLKDVPPERLKEKVGSAVLGAIFGIVGGLMLVGSVIIFAILVLAPVEALLHPHRLAPGGTPPAEPGTVVLIAVGGLAVIGIAFIVIGAAVADFEVVKNPFLFFVAFLKGVMDAVRGKGGGNG